MEPRVGVRRPVRAVAVQQQRIVAVEGQTFAMDQRDRHALPVRRRRVHAFAGVLPRFVSSEDFLDLADLTPAIVHVVIDHGLGRDQRFVHEPHVVGVELGVRRQAQRVGRLVETDFVGPVAGHLQDP